MDENKITLTLKKINKYYPSPKSKHAVHALSDIDLEFVPGWYGITGNNGAGKSTLFQILTGYLKPDSGQILINGSVVNTRSKDYKKMLGYMPQQQMLYESMTCLQFMNYIGSLKGLKGKELADAIKEDIKAKEKDLVGNMVSEGTTPRQITDLLGSLCDLTSGSGDKGTPVVLIQGYFDNYADE